MFISSRVGGKNNLCWEITTCNDLSLVIVWVENTWQLLPQCNNAAMGINQEDFVAEEESMFIRMEDQNLTGKRYGWEWKHQEFQVSSGP